MMMMINSFKQFMLRTCVKKLPGRGGTVCGWWSKNEASSRRPAPVRGGPTAEVFVCGNILVADGWGGWLFEWTCGAEVDGFMKEFIDVRNKACWKINVSVQSTESYK